MPKKNKKPISRKPKAISRKPKTKDKNVKLINLFLPSFLRQLVSDSK